MEEAWELAALDSGLEINAMEKIKVLESNFLTVKSDLFFCDGGFQYQKLGKESPVKKLNIADVSSLSKLRKAGRAYMTEKGIIVVLIFGLYTLFVALFALLFKDMVSKQKFTFVLNFKKGKMFRGVADIDTAFAIQDAWLDEKARRRVEEKQL